MTSGTVVRVLAGIAVVAVLSACDAFGPRVVDSSGSPGSAGVGGVAGGRAGQGGSGSNPFPGGGTGGLGGIGGVGGGVDAAVKVPDGNDAGDEDASSCVPGDCCGFKCTPI